MHSDSVEAHLTSRSLKGVHRGKALYAKSLFCSKTMCEAMKRLLMEKFAKEENIPITDHARLEPVLQSREHQ